jgi:hypothetical protein
MPLVFKSESAFRDWICDQLRERLREGWHVMMGRNVADILVSRQDMDQPVLVFLEVKYHKKIHGRIGIGNQRAGGYQLEYLMTPIPYLEKHLRWVVADEARESAVLLTNEEVRRYAANGIGQGKQNNFQNDLFRKEALDHIPLIDLPARLVAVLENMIPQP